MKMKLLLTNKSEYSTECSLNIVFYSKKFQYFATSPLQGPSCYKKRVTVHSDQMS